VAIGELVDKRGGVLLVLTGVHVDGGQQNLQQHPRSGGPRGETGERCSGGATCNYRHGPRRLLQTRSNLAASNSALRAAQLFHLRRGLTGVAPTRSGRMRA
jgi:hypothetical protein